MYCTLEDAKEAGATGSDARIQRLLDTAASLVDAYCGQAFNSHSLTLTLEPDVDGRVAVPHRILSIYSVTWQESGEAIPAYQAARTEYEYEYQYDEDGNYLGYVMKPVERPAVQGYRYTTSNTAGQPDELILPNYDRMHNALVLGAEPWNGGYRNLTGSSGAARRIVISGSFGYNSAPSAVVEAQALITAHLSTHPDDELTVSLGVEGYARGINSAAVLASSTGVPRADRILTPFRQVSSSGTVIL